MISIVNVIPKERRCRTKFGMTMEKGFTLIELLAGVVILIAIGMVIAGIVSFSLRGANKTTTVENIRRSGNYVLNQMSKDITFALPFDGKNTGLSNDGETYDPSCRFALIPTPTPVTPYNLIAVQSPGKPITKYKCTSSGASPELSANDVSLIDANVVSLQSCSLTCIQNKSTDTPIIKINFSLSPKNSNGLVETSNPPIIFETSVTLRNYRE